MPDRALAGLLLAAGAGRRMGTPKALLRDGDEPWVVRGALGLLRAGCAPVVVVLGAAHAEVRELLAADPRTSGVEVVVADDWAEGIGHSLRAGLEHLGRSSPGVVEAATVMLVDLPDVGDAVLERVADAWTHTGSPSRLLRATYDGRPGHPVVLGRDHWAPLEQTLRGDVGAQAYLTRVDIRRSVDVVECADLATGRDVDRPREEQG